MGAFMQQVKEVWSKLGIQQKVSLGAVGMALILMSLFLGYGATRADYRALVSGVSRAQVYEMSAYLQEQGVQHRVADNETSILVPSKDLYTLRRNLSENGMLGEEGTGFELLDSSSFSDSSFMEQKKYDRAVAGELQRNFREYPGVESARVIIVRAAVSPFLSEQHASSASVKLKMKGSKRLTENQIIGIVRLTSGAVEGLTADRVEVVDNYGLLNQTGEEAGALMASTDFKAEREREKYLKNKAQAILDRIIGAGKGMVTIAVDLDFTERSESATLVDSKNRVAVSEITTTTEESTPIPMNGAGTSANIEEVGLAATQTSELATKAGDESSTKYHVGQRQTTVRSDVGHIRGMNVSIILDYKNITKKAAPAAEGEEQAADTSERIAYTDAEKAQIEKSVLNAIGFYNAKDYQTVSEPAMGVERFTFSTECIDMIPPVAEEDIAIASVGFVSDDIMVSVRYGVAIIVAFALLMIARGQLKRSHGAWEADRIRQEKEDAEKAKLEDVETDEFVLEKRMALKDAISQQIKDNPNAAAEVLKSWMYNG